MTARSIAVARRKDAAIVVEAKAVRVAATVADRRCRPISAVVTDIAEAAIAVVAITRSWVPDGTCGTELAGEVYAFVGTVV